MRIRRKDLDLLAEAYDDMMGPKSMENTEEAEDVQELHPLLQEIKDEIDLGIRWEDFMQKATKGLGERYLPSRGQGLDYFLDKVGNLIKWELEFQDTEDGPYVMGVEDLGPEPSDEDAESRVPRNKLRFQSQQQGHQKPSTGETKPPVNKLKFFSQRDK
jgi:hypothetical protein